MTSEGKTQGQAAREASVRPLLERLKPGEAAAVLRRLLEGHPHLSSAAEAIAERCRSGEICNEMNAFSMEEIQASLSASGKVFP